MKMSKSWVTLIVMTVAGFSLLLPVAGFASCPQGMGAYWKLDDTTYEELINGNSGMVVPPNQAPKLDPTGINGALSFTSAGDTGIDVDPSRAFDWYVTESFSIELWVKTEGFKKTQVFIARDDGAAATKLLWWFGIAADGGAAFALFDRLGNGETVTEGIGTGKLADNKWHHVVLVRQANVVENVLSSTTTIYIDGKSEGSFSAATYTGAFSSATAPLTIGFLRLNGTPDFHFDGSLDEVALYDRALSSTEINDHFKAGQAGEDVCAGVWPFVPYPDNITSLWDLNENYDDAVGQNQGQVVAPTIAPKLDDSGINGSMKFNSAGGTGINVAPSRSFDWYGDENFSIELWAKTEGFKKVQVFVGRKNTGASTLSWWLGIAQDGGAAFALFDRLGNGETVTEGIGTGKLADNQWHHVVLVREASLDGENNILNTTTVYIDGKSEFSSSAGTYAAAFSSLTAPMTIGYFLTGGTTPQFHFDGSLDEVALYSRALSPAEITNHFKAGQAGNDVASLRPTPLANAGADKNVAAGANVILKGTATNPGYVGEGGAIAAYEWTQTDGAAVTLTDADKATATFTAPSSAAILKFQLTATAEDGQVSEPDETVVTVAGGDDGGGGDNGGGTTAPSDDGGGGGCFINTMF
jgi:hypothetical protein